MKKLFALVAATVAVVAVVRRAGVARDEADLWHEATREPDLR